MPIAVAAVTPANLGGTIRASSSCWSSRRRGAVMYAAKWQNITRQPKVCVAVPDGRVHLVVYGTAEVIDADPQRAELSADVLAVVRGPDRPEPSTIIGWLDQDKRGILRITPDKVLLHEQRLVGGIRKVPTR